MIGQAINAIVIIIVEIRSELAIFAVALMMHFLLFGGFAQPKKRGASKMKMCSNQDETSEREVNSPNSARKSSQHSWQESSRPLVLGDYEATLQRSQMAFTRGDYNAVLRSWNTLKNHSGLPAACLANIVESMQRCKKDSNSILLEVTPFLSRIEDACSIDYVNDLLESLAKSLDTQLVMGIIDFLPSLAIELNDRTYDILLHMHFTTRSFLEVTALSQKMTEKGVQLSPKSNMLLLKAALHRGDLSAALDHFRAASTDLGTVPQHIATTLVELACKEHQVRAAIEVLEAGDTKMLLAADATNALLTEALRVDDKDLTNRVISMARNCDAMNARTYQLFIKASSGNREGVLDVLDMMAADGAELSTAVATSVLSMGDVALADKLYEQVNTSKAAQVPILCSLIRFYAEAGTPLKVCNIYEDHLHILHSSAQIDSNCITAVRALLDSRTERCVINAAVECGRKELVQSMLKSGDADTTKQMAMIRSCITKGNLEGAVDMCRTLSHAGIECTPAMHNMVLDALVEGRNLNRAESWMAHMKTEGVADLISYNTMMKMYLKADNFSKARSMMTEMKAGKITPNDVTYNELINALLRSGKESLRTQAWDIVTEMSKTGVHPNQVTCAIVVKSLKANSSSMEVKRAVELMNSMQEPMDEVLISSVAEACVRVGQPGSLLNKLEQLRQDSKVSISGSHTFGSLIKAYGFAKDAKGAWRCWREMRSQHVRPTSITIGCMVEAVTANGDVDGAYELIHELLADHDCCEQVNAVIYGSVLKGFARAHRMDRCWDAWNDMLDHNIAPSISTFNSMIDACTRNACLEKVPTLIEAMKKHGICPNLITYSTRVKGFSQCGDIHAALGVLGEMQQATNLKPDEIMYNTLLDGCVQHGFTAEGERLFEQMQMQGIAPSAYTLSTMAKLMGGAKRTGDAIILVEDLSRKHGIQLTASVFANLIQACIQARDLSRALTVFDWALQEYQNLDSRTWQALVRACLAAEKNTQAIHVLKAVLGLSNSSFWLAKPSDNAFLTETLTTLSSCGGQVAALAAPLYRSLPHSSQSELSGSKAFKYESNCNNHWTRNRGSYARRERGC